MATITKSGYRGQGEAVPNVSDAKQGAVNPTISDGNRDAGAIGTEPQANNAGQGEGVRRFLVNGKVFTSLKAASLYMMTK